MSGNAEAEANLLRGESARREGRLADAATAFSNAADAYRTAEDGERLSHALSCQAKIARDDNDLLSAIRWQQEALALARELPDPVMLAHHIRHLADIFQEMGKPAMAAPLYTEMMVLYGAAPGTPPLEIANATRSVASNTEALGDKAAAVKLWREARTLYQALDALFRDTYGLDDNPGVAEADRRLAGLSSSF